MNEKWRSGAGTTEAKARLAAAVGTAFGFAAGCAIAWVDTRPNWDDTGVSAGLLFLAGGCVAAVGVRWWLTALLIAGPTIILEYRTAGAGVLVIVAMAGLGALVGQGVRRMLERQGGSGA